MNAALNKLSLRPRVCLFGDSDHPDFATVIALIRSGADVTFDAKSRPSSELVVLAQSRPGSLDIQRVDRLRRDAPLAGFVALLGSWCEGQGRAGRPSQEVTRLYWYQFAVWWQRQLALRAAGDCPDWARPGATNWQLLQLRTPSPTTRGIVLL